MGSGILCMSLPYTPETIPAKIGAFALFSSLMGATLAPMALIGGMRLKEHSFNSGTSIVDTIGTHVTVPIIEVSLIQGYSFAQHYRN